MKDNLHSITEFRANMYGMIDRMLETGEPLLLRRNNQIVEVRVKTKRSSAKKKAKKRKLRDLSKIIPMDCMTEPPEWYISPKLHEWSGEIDLNLR